MVYEAYFPTPEHPGKVLIVYDNPFSLQVLSVQLSALPFALTTAESPRTALALCADPRLDVLVAEETPFADIAARLPDILGAPGALCHLIRY